MSTIRKYSKDEIEYIRLKTFANICNDIFRAHCSQYHIDIQNIYFDFGQNWWYTAPVTEDYSKNESWQSLVARDYELIITCDSFADMQRYADYYANEIMNDNIVVHLYKLDQGFAE